jgi:hypothetical protein
LFEISKRKAGLEGGLQSFKGIIAFFLKDETTGPESSS